MPIKIINRSSWDPDPAPENNFFLRTPVQHVFFMNTNSPRCENHLNCVSTLRIIKTIALRTQHLPDIRYNFLVGDDGLVYEGKGWHMAPLLPLKWSRYNLFSILIGFIGKQTEVNLSEKVAEVTADLLEFGIENSLITKNFELKNITLGVHDRNESLKNFSHYNPSNNHNHSLDSSLAALNT